MVDLLLLTLNTHYVCATVTGVLNELQLSLLLHIHLQFILHNIRVGLIRKTRSLELYKDV